MLNGTGIMKENNLQMDVAKKIFADNLDKEWQSIQLNAITECATKGVLKNIFHSYIFLQFLNYIILTANQVSTHTTNTVNGGVCTDYSRLFVGCLHTEQLKVCIYRCWKYCE